VLGELPKAALADSLCLGLSYAAPLGLPKSGMRTSVSAHKDLKDLKTQNLCHHMIEAELIFTALAELSTRRIAETTAATGMVENKAAAQTGGKIARRARLELEAQTGKKVVTGENYLPPGDAKQIQGPNDE
jgi:DNA-damage-inducible protein D